MTSADLAIAAQRLEDACNKRAALLTQQAYLDAEAIPGMRDVLDELDSARNDVRAALAAPSTPSTPDAYVPIHPRTGPLWSNVVESLDKERPSYPVKGLYFATPTSAPEALSPPSAGLSTLCNVVETLHATGHYSDEEGEATNNLSDLATFLAAPSTPPEALTDERMNEILRKHFGAYGMHGPLKAQFFSDLRAAFSELSAAAPSTPAPTRGQK